MSDKATFNTWKNKVYELEQLVGQGYKELREFINIVHTNETFESKLKEERGKHALIRNELSTGLEDSHKKLHLERKENENHKIKIAKLEFENKNLKDEISKVTRQRSRLINYIRESLASK